MTQYESTVEIRRPAADVFDYVGDVQRLPEYFPQITSVEQLDGDTIRTTAHIEPPDGPARDVEGQAWFRVRTAGRSLEWGSEGPNNYRGELDVDPGDDSSCTLTVRITTDRDSDSIEEQLQQTAQGLADSLEEKTGQG